MTIGPFIWRLTEAREPAADPVEAALGLEVAKLSYGPLEFDFAKTCSRDGKVS